MMLVVDEPNVYVIPVASLLVPLPPAIVNVTLASCVIVPVYPVQSIDLIVMFALIVALPEPLDPLKKTSSVDPGTDASFAPPLVADQFVGPVAFHASELPPPTQ